MGSTGVSRDYRPDIDGLRAVAILAVVLYHAEFAAFRGGFVGVDVFFVLSGYLITRYLALELATKGKIDFLAFYARRIRRLFPALIAVIFATSVVWVILAGLGDAWQFARSMRWSLFGLANLFFRRNTGGYFDGPVREMPLLHLWSLGVEEQFYFFWPLLFAFASRWSWRVRTGAIGLGLLASLGVAEAFVRRGEASTAFFMMPVRAWELGVGVMLAVASPFAGSGAFFAKRPGASSALAAIGVGAILYPVFAYGAETPFPGISAALPVLGTALLIAAGEVDAGNPISRSLAHPWFVRIGLLSYGWYLWHWPLLAASRVWALGRENAIAIRLGILGFSLVLAWASFRWVESPIRFGKRWKAVSSRRMLAFGLVVSLAGFGASFLVPKLERASLSARFGKDLIDRVWERPEFGEGCFGPDAIGSERCTADFRRDKAVPGVRWAIWGDSHAGSYFPLVADYARKTGGVATLYTTGRTPPVLPNGFGDAVIADLKKGDPERTAVVLAARWPYYTGAKAIARTSEGTEPRFDLDGGIGRTLARLEEIGVRKVFVILPYPEFPEYVFRCLVKGAELCDRSVAAELEYQSEARKVLRALGERHPGVRLLDPVPLLCPNGVCRITAGQTPLVVDDNHPSVEGVRGLEAAFFPEFDGLISAKRRSASPPAL